MRVHATRAHFEIMAATANHALHALNSGNSLDLRQAHISNALWGVDISFWTCQCECVTFEASTARGVYRCDDRGKRSLSERKRLLVVVRAPFHSPFASNDIEVDACRRGVGDA